MKIVIPGGTGQVGTILARAFLREGHDVIVLGRSPEPRPFDAAQGRPFDVAQARAWRVLRWDPAKVDEWWRVLDGADAVINLAGRSVNCRYTPQHRREILESRVTSVRAVGEAIARARRPPRVWLQASTATIYAHTYGAPHDEWSGVIGGSEPDVPDTWRFSIDVATAWERVFDEAETPATRKVALRSAMTMSPDPGGIFDALLTLVQRGLGGAAGGGRQYMSWIHETDFVRAIDFVMARDDMHGAVNVASPNPIPNAEFMTALRRAWGTSIALPSSRWMLEIGARLMRSETELILKSRRVVPGRLLREGFTFIYPDWPDAARDLCRRSKAIRAPAA